MVIFFNQSFKSNKFNRHCEHVHITQMHHVHNACLENLCTSLPTGQFPRVSEKRAAAGNFFRYFPRRSCLLTVRDYANRFSAVKYALRSVSHWQIANDKPARERVKMWAIIVNVPRTLLRRDKQPCPPAHFSPPASRLNSESFIVSIHRRGVGEGVGGGSGGVMEGK